MKRWNAISLGLALCLGLSAGATLFSGCASSRENRTTGQYIDDEMLAHKVTSALHNDTEYKLNDVGVKAFQGKVQLSGFVQSEDQKKKAEDITRNVQGVQGIENNITVRTSS
jgi:osmotically-inducible protein OsmY